MRNTILTLISVVFVFGSGFSQGVNFENIEYDEVVMKAKKEKKLIFVDVYTDWCAPCRKMDREVFPDKELGDYINANFVSYKADGQMSTGKMLARKYGVGSYPHYLFLDTKGNLIYKVRGFMRAHELIEEARVAADPGSYNQYQLYKRKFNAGNRDKHLLKEYLKLGYKRYKEVDAEVYDAFFNSLDLMDKQDDENLVLVARYVPFSEGRAYDLAKDYYWRIKDDSNHIHRVDIGNNLLSAVDRSLEKQCKDGNSNILEELLSKKEELLFNQNPGDTIHNIKEVELDRVQFFACSNDKAAYLDWSGRYVEAFLWDDERFARDTTVEKGIQEIGQDMEDAAVLAEFAEQYLEFFEEKDPLFTAESWIDQAIRWDDKLEYHTVKAYITDKLGDKREAVNIARRALERARKEKSDYANDIQDVLMSIVDGKMTKGVK